MTQRYVAVPEKGYDIMVGWDRPLQHYFITVFRADAGPEEEEVVWSSLDDKTATMGGGLPWPAILARFEEYAGQTLPESVRELLRADRIATTAREGNVISRHRLDGAPLPPDLRPADPAEEDPFAEEPPMPGIEP